MMGGRVVDLPSAADAQAQMAENFLDMQPSLVSPNASKAEVLVNFLNRWVDICKECGGVEMEFLHVDVD
jgi:hypothetical protein